MGKPIGKKKTQVSLKSNEGNMKQSKVSDRNLKALDEDTAVFINMSQELKEEGNKFFQKHDHEGAMLKYERALKLLPRNHIDVAHLRSNMAACYMQMGIGEYPRAINECNLALEVAPKYSKSLLKRATCYEALNHINLALRDVKVVLNMEPNNLTALELADKLKNVMETNGFEIEDNEVLPTQFVQLPSKILKEKMKKKNNKIEKRKIQEAEVKTAKDKITAEEKIAVQKEKLVTRTVKLVFGDDIRSTQIPVNCGIRVVREIIQDRFPNMKGVLIKYKDVEGDYVTITTSDELCFVESLTGPLDSLRLYIVEGSVDQDPMYDRLNHQEKSRKIILHGEIEKESSSCIENWVTQFARLFKNHVGFDSDSYLDLHELGMKLYSEALEDTVTCDDSQQIFEIAASNFQEMTALSLFNWGIIHMNRARKRAFFTDEDSKESIVAKVKTAYEYAQKEYMKAGLKYEEALKFKPDFYEGLIALGLQQFELAKLSWYYAIGSKTDLKTGTSTKVLELYNKAEDSMERGMQMWEEIEEQRLNGLYISDKYKDSLMKQGLEGLFKDLSPEEAEEQVGNMKSQIYLLWGTLLYERSVVEFKLSLLSWEECLEVSVEKFELAGASSTDIGVMIKNHCSNGTAIEGFGFKIDEIVHAWNEMYDAKRWGMGVPAFRLEPLFRRRVPKLHFLLEHI